MAFIFLIARVLDLWTVFTLDADNARFFLSSVAQSVAALFALVITVSLIIMQLLTQSYTYKIFEVYFKNPQIRSFFGVVAFTFIFSLFLLLRIDSHALPQQAFSVDLVLLLTALSTYWLFIYVSEMLHIANPEGFLEMLQNALTNNANKSKALEIITIIGDICILSMGKRDFHTAKHCTDIYDVIYDDLNEDGRHHLMESLHNLYEKACEIDNTEMISIITMLSIDRPMDDLISVISL